MVVNVKSKTIRQVEGNTRKNAYNFSLGKEFKGTTPKAQCIEEKKS